MGVITKRFPSSEICWVHGNINGKEYFITSKQDRSEYFLYEVVNGKLIKRGQNKSPDKLEDKYIKEK